MVRLNDWTPHEIIPKTIQGTSSPKGVLYKTKKKEDQAEGDSLLQWGISKYKSKIQNKVSLYTTKKDIEKTRHHILVVVFGVKF